MVGDQVDKEHRREFLGFNLRFTKTRRRKPSNAHDFKNVYVSLDGDKWSYGDPVSTAGGRPNKSEDIALRALREVSADGDASEQMWRERAYELGISESNKEESRRRASGRARDALIDADKVVKEGNRYSISGVT
jgi:hypothetical protein